MATFNCKCFSNKPRKFNAVKQTCYREKNSRYANPVNQFIGFIGVALAIFIQPLMDCSHCKLFALIYLKKMIVTIKILYLNLINSVKYIHKKTSCFMQEVFYYKIFIIKLKLNNQHCISITEETIFIFYCFFISIHNKIITGKSACHN